METSGCTAVKEAQVGLGVKGMLNDPRLPRLRIVAAVASSPRENLAVEVR